MVVRVCVRGKVRPPLPALATTRLRQPVPTPLRPQPIAPPQLSGSPLQATTSPGLQKTMPPPGSGLWCVRLLLYLGFNMLV